MRWAQVARKILQLAEAIHRWLGALSNLEPERKKRIADYAEKIAETLARSADALAEIDHDPSGISADPRARHKAIRELARLHGYVSTIVDVLNQQLDGRRLAGVKKRLETLDSGALEDARGDLLETRKLRIEKLYAAEGYFRALADGLRV